MSEFQDLLHEIERIEGCEKTKERIKSVLRTRMGRRIRFSPRAFTHPQHLRAAVSMLRSGMARSEAREALMVRFGVGRVTAYGLLSQALTELARERNRIQQQDLFTHE